MLNKILWITGLLLIFSLMTRSPLFLVICLTLFIIAVVVNCCDLFKGKNIPKLISEKTQKDADEGFKNGQYHRFIINTSVIPMMVIGIITVVLCMINLWHIALG